MEKLEYSTTIKHETILDDTATNSPSCATSKDDTAPYSDAFSDDISRGNFTLTLQLYIYISIYIYIYIYININMHGHCGKTGMKS